MNDSVVWNNSEPITKGLGTVYWWIGWLFIQVEPNMKDFPKVFYSVQETLR